MDICNLMLFLQTILNYMCTVLLYIIIKSNTYRKENRHLVCEEIYYFVFPHMGKMINICRCNKPMVIYDRTLFNINNFPYCILRIPEVL